MRLYPTEAKSGRDSWVRRARLANVIVTDSSASIAIFRQEDDAAQYAHSIATDEEPIMSAANVVG
jgi:hypothetical protein